MRPLALLAAAGLVLAACARQEEPLTIAEVNVDTDLASIGSPEAVAYWQDLSADLETALASQFVGRIGETGRTVNVDVDELSLSNALTANLADEDARLAGRVEVINADGTTDSAYRVTATTNDVMTFLPPGTDIVSVPPTSAAFYGAVVQAFARGTAEVVLQDA
jgi:hypothetical protein